MVHRTLDNGLQIWIDPTGEADVAAVYLWVRAGSALEPAGFEGGAHLLEHMVFKGTRSHGVGGVASAIEGMGGDLNAFTSFDDTAYHCTVPAGRAPEALEVLAEMMRTAVIDPDELARERQVVLEEIRGGDDDPDLVVGEASWAAAFPSHPYGRSVIGTVESVSGITRDDLVAFYERWYQPSNAVLSVSGPVDVDAVLAAAARALGGGHAVPSLSETPAQAVAPAPQVLKRGFEATLVQLNYPCGAVDLAREAVLDVLASALAGGRSSPMEVCLRRSEQLCQSVSASTALERDAGLFTITLHAHAGRATEALAVARACLAEAAAGGLSAQDVARAKAGLSAGLLSRREHADTRASDLASDVVKYNDAAAWRTYLRHVEGVTAGDVQRAAAVVLDPAKEVLVALVADDESLELDNTVKLGAEGGAPPSATPPPPVSRRLGTAASPRAPATTRHVLENGLRVILDPAATDVVAVRVAGLGGLRAAPASASGRVAAWARMLTRGAAGLDAHTFAEEVESLGAGMSAMAGRSAQVVRGDFVRGNADAGLELFADMLLQPEFPDDELVLVRHDMLAALDERDDSPELIASERMWARLYPGHPYGAPAGGTRGTLGRLGTPALRELHARWLRADNLVLTVAGGFDPDRMLRKIRRWFGRLSGGWKAPAVVSPAPPPDTVRLRVGSDREQAHVIVAWPGARVAGPEQPVVELAAGVLGGQGGRLFLQLREEHGLAYSVGAHGEDGWDSGLLVGGIATDPDRIDEAESRLVATVQALAEAEVPAAELERARAAHLGGIEAELQATSSRAALASLTELYGNDGTAYRALARGRVQDVTAAQIRAWAAGALVRPLAVARVEPR